MSFSRKQSLSIMVVLLIIDQVSKIMVQEFINKREIIPMIPNFIELTYVQNKGVSFSFLSDLDDVIRLPLLIGISSIAVIGMLIYLLHYWNENDIYLKVGFTLIIPGAFGNLIDRIAFGAVTDFMHFHWYEHSFFVNNIADCFISVGVVIFIFSSIVEARNAQANEDKEPTA